MEQGQKINPYRLFVGVHIPNALLRHEKLSLGAAVCYGRLAQYAGEDGLAYPSHKTLAKELGVTPRSIQKYIKELEREGFLRIINRVEAETKIQQSNVYEFLWNNVLADSLRAYASTPPENISPPPTKIIPPPGEKIADKESPLIESVNNNNDHYSTDFETFWSMYPRKVAKKDAYGKWKATLRKGVSVETLLRSVTNYASKCDVESTDEKYIKHPATFLGPNEHYNDYLTLATPTKLPEHMTFREREALRV